MKEKENFIKRYDANFIAMKSLVDEAKFFIIDNYRNNKINWNQFSISMKNDTGYFRFGLPVDQKLNGIRSKVARRILESIICEPITSINFVLDEMDDDFSVEINEKLFLKIDDLRVIFFASFIEKSLVV